MRLTILRDKHPPKKSMLTLWDISHDYVLDIGKATSSILIEARG
ncbi:hypothetical protein YPPY01_2276 [Yersinia pestis PY-01]|nr:hypothetical protein YpAngola_A2493 [Yersinia pestis Angola]EDR44006.1 hypothetical protein YpE1979001_0362 [Yersinia pestis biovar Antiqua str. E1979001]EDR57856.1 hypothetical protein YpMG051020_3444 [Yersinia pestis biovar Orientalis str. MG05-1020]EDR66337.1 hypothetical protein YpK1973002_3961 [Yersinia pestis biovar Mediaevalis str. K1973002]EIQ88628.1 hypothetical protein YPPY01_2276 [Yersinia pestis PY-01]EIQ90136.1 hypothetical protein YPPY02_2306 [Yersinia pestis PY-02]EIR03914.1